MIKDNQKIKFIPVDPQHEVKIDFSQIPEYQRRQLAEFALEITKECFAQPRAEEKYQEWRKARRKKRSHERKT